MGEELRAAQKLRKEVEGDLVRYNVQARKQAHEHCSDCAEQRKEERDKLRAMLAADKRRKEGKKLEAEAEADFKHREASQTAQSASLPMCEYTARSEDTFGGITKLFGIVPRLLREENDIAPAVSGWFDKPATGRRLRIPAPRSRARASCDMEAKLCPYVVRTGDSLGFIADKMGASRLHIALVNQLPSSEFAYYPAAQTELKIPNPSEEGADNCREVPHKATVPALSLPRVPRKSKVADVMPPHKRSSKAGSVAADAEETANRAEAKSEEAMKAAKEDRERATAAKEALEEAEQGKADAQRAYRAAHEAGDKAAMREALAREDRLAREASAKRERATAAKKQAQRTTAEAQEASAQWQAKSVQAEQAAVVAEAHEDLESAVDGQSMDQHGSTGATGAGDLDFRDHAQGSVDDDCLNKRAVEESAEVQLKRTRAELARVRAHAMAQPGAEAGAGAVDVAALKDSAAASLIEVARRRRAGSNSIEEEEKEADANTKHQRELDSQLEGFLTHETEGDEEEEEAGLEEDLEGAQEEIASLRRQLKSSDEERDEAREEAARARDAANVSQQRAATAVAGEQEAFEERDESREKARQAREEADELEAQLTREEEEESKASKELEGTEGSAKSARARAAKLKKDLARATERARSLAKRVEKLSTDLNAERTRRVRLGGKLVALHSELVQAHQEAVDANERSDRMTRERNAAERRLQTVVESQERAERQVHEEQARAAARKADEKAALKEAKAQQAEAQHAAAAVTSDGEAHRDPCARATAAQTEAHDLSLQIRITNATVYKDRVELDRLQPAIEKLDDQAEALRDDVAARLRTLQNAVGLREDEMRAYHSTAEDHDAALDSARDMRGLLVHSRMGLTNGELRAYAGDAAWHAHKLREEKHADGSGSQTEADAKAEADAMGARMEANALSHLRAGLVKGEEQGGAAALLQVGGGHSGAKSPSQRSAVRRLREYLNSIVGAAQASKSGLENAETRHHTKFVDEAEELRHAIDKDRLELGRVQRERSRLQVQREAYQDSLMRSVASLEDMHRRYKDATHLVLVSLEKCNGSSSSLQRGEVTLTDGN